MGVMVEDAGDGLYFVDGTAISFRYDSKRHKYIVNFDFSRHEREFTEKEGKAIMEFLNWLSTLTVEESFDSQGAWGP